MAPGIDSLVSFDPNGGDWRNTAIIGGPWESDSSLAFGFFDIADTAVEQWKAGRRNDAIVIPIIYNYRHGIELALKEGIREAAACLRSDGAADPDIQTSKIDEWMSTTHSIKQLVNRLTRLLDQLQLGPGQQLPAETLDILRKLHLLDQHGQAFRYSAEKTGSRAARVLERVRPGEQRFDIVAVAEALREAGTMVLYGVSGVLDDYSAYQAEMRQAAGQQADQVGKCGQSSPHECWSGSPGCTRAKSPRRGGRRRPGARDAHISCGHPHYRESRLHERQAR